MRTDSVYAIIPARGGSKGIPGKNIKPLAGYPLIAYSIAAAKLSKNVSRTIVSTDSQEIVEIAKRYGGEVPFFRPAELAQDKSTDLEFVVHAINWFRENEGKVPNYLVHLRPTTPLRDPVIIDQAIDEIRQKKVATSLRSGHPASESPFKWFLRDPEGFFSGIIPGYTNDQLNNPRQSFPDVYIPDGYVDVLKTSFISSSHLLHGDRMIGFPCPHCVEVDSIKDFEFLDFEMKKNGSPVFNYLKENFSPGL